MVHPMPCNCHKHKSVKKNVPSKKPCTACKRKGFKTYATKGVKKRVKVPLPMIQTYH